MILIQLTDCAALIESSLPTPLIELTKTVWEEDKMNTSKKTARILEDVKINVKIKLAGLWATVMFIYIYTDIVAFYSPKHIENVIAGEVGGMQITPLFLLGVMVLMTIPSLMVFLSLTLKAKPNRWVNIILGILLIGLALFISLSSIGDILAYGIFATIAEIVVLSLIVWYAWKWPKQEA